MSKKPKFLYKPSEMGDWFASLGRKLIAIKKSGAKDWGVKDRYREQGELLRNQNVTVRHIRWQKVYAPAYREALKQAQTELNKNDQQAFKYARQRGENAVLVAFADEVKTSRAVRDAMQELDYGVDE